MLLSKERVMRTKKLATMSRVAGSMNRALKLDRANISRVCASLANSSTVPNRRGVLRVRRMEW